MPTITKPGELPERKLYEAECSYCKTEFTFHRDEATFRASIDQSDQDALIVDCPLEGCTQKVTVWL